MTNLTEKWKNGELINEEDAGCYYIETIDGEIYPDCLSPIDGFKNTYNYAVKKILAPVPSYAEWQSLNELVDCMSDTGKAFAHMLSPFTDDYFNGLTTKDIAELAKKSIRLTTQHCEDNAEIDKLQTLLGKCYRFLILTETKVEAIEKVKRGLVKEIDEVLK